MVLTDNHQDEDGSIVTPVRRTIRLSPDRPTAALSAAIVRSFDSNVGYDPSFDRTSKSPLTAAQLAAALSRQ
jgi:hypothetical protein